ncbi:glucose 1-dehydrogenase [Alkalihalobacillus oceani]|uniref:SDR family NAD(P)-dependent oxidoreductase n=1 Tax=Halalkalibacter oceani TaxID=1653776 RepID=UPI00203CD12D|nr:glucose 1-dehydrogenase [Halalkalibacter oceani]MCM3762299.1 glucose 1-dehydrogenase [Halalkalibacter oceani]
MVLNSFDLTNKVAIVTGSGSGIGKTIALGLAESGASIVVTELPGKEEVARETAAEIEKLGQQVLVTTLDVTKVETIRQMVSEVKAHFGRIDILVNNAGIIIRKPSLEVTEEDWDKVHDVNLKGTFFTSQEVAKVMKENGGGKIVNIASINGVVGFYERAAYCSSKAGIVNLTRVLAIDWAEYGINVNAVGPNYLLTPLTEKLFANDEFREDVLYRTPIKRIGTPEDVVGAVVYLASPAANFVTGHTVMVDGGWTAW